MAPRRWRIFIREWREHRGLTQAALGERIGRDESTISEIERGNIGYTRDTLEAIALALDCDPPDLLSRAPDDRNAALRMVERLLKDAPPDGGKK
jgi:transcriptional regulator with XRE-family HTH domain